MHEEALSTVQPEQEVKHRLSTLRFYGDQFVFNTVSGMFYRVTASAGYVLHALDSGATTAELPGLLQARYGIERKAALRDVELLLNDLTAMGILDQINP
jgi:hypothetical protein